MVAPKSKPICYACKVLHPNSKVSFFHIQIIKNFYDSNNVTPKLEFQKPYKRLSIHQREDKQFEGEESEAWSGVVS